MSSNVLRDDLTIEDALECPFHHCKPFHKYIESDRWSGYQTYCKKCSYLFNKLYKNGSGIYYHSLWKLAQSNSATKSASIFLWNCDVEDVLESDDFIKTDIIVSTFTTKSKEIQK